MITDDIREAIKVYFYIGLLYRDIVRVFAIEHGVVISLRQLNGSLENLVSVEGRTTVALET